MEQEIQFPQKQFHAIMQGHVLDCLRQLPSDSVDTICTSPPYWGLRDYNLQPTIWDGVEGCEHEFTVEAPPRRNRTDHDSKGKQSTVRGSDFNLEGTHFCSRCDAWRGQLGLEPEVRFYVQHMMQVTAELKRVLKPSGSLWLNLGDTYSTNSRNWGASNPRPKDGAKSEKARAALPIMQEIDTPEKSLCFIPQRVAMSMIDQQGWILRNQIVWFKPNGMPSSVKDRFGNRWEPVFFFVKDRDYWFDLDAVRVPHQGGQPAKFNLRVRDVQKRRIKGPQWYATNAETEAYDEKAQMEDAQKHSNVDQPQGPARKKHSGYFGEDGELLVNQAGKNPGDVIDGGAILGESGVVEVPGGQGWTRSWPGGGARIMREGDPRWLPPTGKNPGDVIRENAVRHKALASNPGHEFTHDRKYEQGKDGTDFWEITTQPHPFAHFAVYPDALVERPIKASCPLKICLRCGKARERLSKVNHIVDRKNLKAIEPKSEGRGEKFGHGLAQHETVGWTDCPCPTIVDNEGLHKKQYRPGIVLDPFIGSGTTSVVAKKLGRSSIGIELSSEYIPIIKSRLDWGHNTLDSSIEWIEF